MSLDARKRVWATTFETATHKLIMLVLAEHANEQGFCWVGAERIAELSDQNDVDYVRKQIKRLVAAGHLLQKRGGGRGVVSIFCVAVGLDEQQRAQRNTVLQSSVIKNNTLVVELKQLRERVVSGNENPVLENTVLENTVFQCEKTLYYSLEAKSANSAAESAETTQKEGRNDLKHDDDDVGAHEQKINQQQTTLNHVAYLSRKGMGAAHQFARLNPAAAIADFDNRIADDWDIAAIVKAWRSAPPEKGNIYERRHNEQDQPARSASAATRSATQQTRQARAGDAGYYAKRIK